MLDLKLKPGRLYVLSIYLYICIIHLPLSSPCYWSKLSITFKIILWKENPETPQIFVEETIFKFCKQRNFSNAIQTHATTSAFMKNGHKCSCHFLQRSYTDFSYTAMNLNTYWDILEKKTMQSTFMTCSSQWVLTGSGFCNYHFKSQQ